MISFTKLYSNKERNNFQKNKQFSCIKIHSELFHFDITETWHRNSCDCCDIPMLKTF